MKDIKGNILTGIACLLTFCLFVFIWALTFQSIGIDSTNKATIISGLLSMLGGMFGALTAYLIAREQLTKQLELQDKKDRSRVLLETKLRKAEEVLEILTRTKMHFFGLQGVWTSIIRDYGNYIRSHITEDVNYEELKNKGLIDALDKHRDDFIFTYSECYKYKPYFPYLIQSIERDHNETFKQLTLDINKVIVRLSGIDDTVETFRDLWRSVKDEIQQINDNFVVTFEKINNQIINTENEINQILLDFK